MSALLDIPIQVWAAQVMLGIINGSFYAVLSLGLAIIFGLLHIINFAHGAFYMLGAMCAWMLLSYLGMGYWTALVVVPLVVAAAGMVLERVLIARLRDVDHLYGLLLTFGVALMLQSAMRFFFGGSGLPYNIPQALSGGWQLGFMYLPIYRAWVVVAALVACVGVWLLIERTRLGAYLRAATENPALVAAFGINVPLLITLTYGLGTGLAAFAGVLATPIYTANPLMGVEILTVVFAVVVVGGMGSVIGAICTGFGLGVVEGLTKVIYPEASATVIFVIMIVVLLVRPRGLFGKY